MKNMRRTIQKGKLVFRKSREQETSNSTAGNVSSSTEPTNSGVIAPTAPTPPTLTDSAAQRNVGSSAEAAGTNPTIPDPQGEQIATAEGDGRITVTTAEGSTQQPVSEAITNDETRSLWQRALDGTDLSLKERQTLHRIQVILKPNATATEVSGAFGKFMEEFLKTRQDKGWKFNFRGKDIGMRDVGRNIISFLDKFKEIGDIIVQYDPVHAALPWAGFRFLLKICIEKQKAVEPILIGLEKMTFLIEQCALYEILYLNLNTEASKLLEKHMLRLYTVILKILAIAVDRLQDNHVQAVFTTDEVSDNLRKVEEIAKAVEIYAQITETQNTRAGFEELKKLLRELNENHSRLQPQLKVIQKRLDQSRRSEILRWISEIHYTEHHRRISSERLEGTGDWIFKGEEYSDWSHYNTSKILLLGGIPGAGKTYTASTVIDSFLKTTGRLAYFYCNRAEEHRRDPQKILATIIQQLSQGSKEGLLTPVVTIYEDRESKGQTTAKLSLIESQDLLVQLAELYPNQETTICIDAMDEVNNETRLALLEALKDVIVRSKSVIKIFITTRMDRDIIKQFKIFPLIELQPDDNAADSLLETILIYNWMNTSFQLAALQIQLLRRVQIKEDIAGALRKAYDEIYRNIHSQFGKSAMLALNAFRWIQCSLLQLRSEELLNAVNAEVSSTGEFCTISAGVDAETLLAVCQNLVILDRSLNVFRFAHLSVDEYLETKLPKEDSHWEIASICLSVLCTHDTVWDTLPPDSDLETDEALEGKDFLFMYSNVCWPWHFAKCGHINRVGYLLRQLWDKFNAADPASGNNAYIGRWVRHYSACLKMVRKPFGYESDSFDGRSEAFAEFSTIITVNEYTLACVCVFALYPVLPVLIETIACTGVRQSTLNLLLSRSAEQGDLGIVQLLIDKGASVSATNIYGDTPLHIASTFGYNEVAQLLIDKGASVAATAEDGNTPLHAASSGGHMEVAQLLIDKGASVSATDIYGNTPLHTASSSGHKEVAQLLIDKGANVSAKSIDGETPLDLAIRDGNCGIVELLLNKEVTTRYLYAYSSRYVPV